MTETCTCHSADWFHGDQSIILTIGCPVHGDPDGIQPYESPDEQELML
jgi:hypothetical protein